MIEGATVYFWVDDGGWRTGVFLGIVEHTASTNGNFGLYRIKPNTLERAEILIPPERVQLIKAPEVADLLE